jgi:hypothetical protein
VVKLVQEGVKTHWWRPLDQPPTEANGGARRKGPLSGEKSAQTGEGTIYGKRPKRAQRAHAQPSRKPQQ